MTTVKYDSFNPVTREVKFDVDGEFVSRKIADHVDEGMVNDHMKTLGEGLAVEFLNKIPEVKTEAIAYEKGETIATLEAQENP